MHTTMQVSLGTRSYPIFIGEGLLNERELINNQLGTRQIVVITNEIVAPLYLKQLRDAVAQDEFYTLILPDGEATKSLHRFAEIQGFLLERRIERSAMLVALGGGVIGDLVGFAAACYQRGVDYVQIPTTLLAQVDSSVGGKTAVNHPLGKNMIGAFHQPRAVIADTCTLATLPDREFRSGLAEVIKYGLIQDTSLLEWLEAHMEALLARDHGALAHAIRRSCENKAEVVVDDEREAGRRALLNFGHTFGHAIETSLGYGAWLHGEAVAAGMCMATRMSALCGWLSSSELDRVVALIDRAGLPTAPPPAITPQRFRELMSQDKKNEGGRIRLVLLKALGQACVTSAYDDAKLSEILCGVKHANHG
jgi:3-dehydroquinate synthase